MRDLKDDNTRQSDLPAIDDAIAEYLRRVDLGLGCDREAFIASHPHLEAELRAFFDDAALLSGMATPPSALDCDTDRGETWPTGELALPQQFADYELLEEIAVGGMGCVYKARQPELDRIVAVKLIRAGALATKAQIDRFRQEARSMARLRHPGIVRVYDVGYHADRHYFSMEYAAGGSLAVAIRDQPLDANRAARYGYEIAQAVDYAHAQGIVHRDLKPSNVLIADDGRLLVSDFGLAKVSASDSDLTESGERLGTPSYMSPEQARGDQNIGVASDVYALGATLYALLSGRPPFQAARPEHVLLQVINTDAPSLRNLNPALPRDLETICHKCLRKDPTKRYTSAREVAEELQRFLDGKPILARPVSRAERVWRWARRDPRTAGLIAAMFLLIALTALGALVAALQFNRQRRAAEENLEIASRAIDKFLTEGSEDPALRFMGLEHVRRDFLEAARDHYASVATRAPADLAAQQELADVLFRLSQINLALDEYALAEQRAMRCMEVCRGLFGDERFGDKARHLTAASFALLADGSARRNRIDEGISRLRSGIEHSRLLADAHPKSVAYTRHCGALLTQLANLQLIRQDRVLSRETLDAAEKWLRSATQLDSHDEITGWRLGEYDLARARLHELDRDYDEALRQCEEALKLLENVFVDNNALNAAYLISLAHAFEVAGRIEGRSSLEAAGEYFVKCCSAWRTLALNFPNRPRYGRGWAASWRRIANYHRLRRGPGASAVDLEEAIRIMQEVVRAHPKNIEYQQFLYVLWCDLTEDWLDELDRMQTMEMTEAAKDCQQQARRALREVIRLKEEMAAVAKDAGTPIVELRLRMLMAAFTFHEAFGFTFEEKEEENGYAIGALLDVEGKVGKLLKDDDANVDYIVLQARCNFHLAQCAERKGDRQWAAPMRQQAIDLLEELPMPHDSSHRARYLLQMCRNTQEKK